MKKNKIQERLLEELEKMPIVQVACEKVGISRNTFYTWKKTDPELLERIDAAIEKGEDYINDISENQLMSLIKDRNFPALSLWLKSHHPKYNTNKTKEEAEVKIEGLFDILKRGLAIK